MVPSILSKLEYENMERHGIVCNYELFALLNNWKKNQTGIF